MDVTAAAVARPLRAWQKAVERPADRAASDRRLESILIYMFEVEIKVDCEKKLKIRLERSRKSTIKVT
jgi:hypothetical protein